MGRRSIDEHLVEAIEGLERISFGEEAVTENSAGEVERRKKTSPANAKASAGRQVGLPA